MKGGERDVSGRFENIEPTELGWTADGHAAAVWSDGHRSTYSPEHLRMICPCAECQGTHGTPPKAFKILSDHQVQGAPLQVQIRSVEPVGHYAIAFHWGDGHKEGIYSWPFLRSECPCEICA